MDPIVITAGHALIRAAAGDGWPQVREAIAGLWPDEPGQLQAGGAGVGAELDDLRQQVLRARATGDTGTEKALEGVWQIKLQQLLHSGPAAAPDLSRVTNQVLIPALFLAQKDAEPGPGQDAGGNGLAISTAVIGQAAAGLTAVAAVIYGSGALTIALRLFFTHLSWETVLGQLPHDVLLTTGFGQIILPSIIIGMLGAVFINYLVNDEHRGAGSKIQLRMQRYLMAQPSVSHFLAWLFTAAFFGTLEAIVSLPFYVSHAHSYFNSGVVIPAFDAILVAAILSAVAVGVALIMLPHPRAEGLRRDLHAQRNSRLRSLIRAAAGQLGRRTRAGAFLQRVYRERQERKLGRERWKTSKPSSLSPMGWMIWVGALIAFASVPGVATFAAVTLFPDSKACSTEFLKGRLEGNLIATNGGWAYMVEYENTTPVEDFIAAVPLSSLQMETIGHAGTCGNLVSNPVNSPSPTPSASK